MFTQKRCIACLRKHTDHSIGIPGVFKNQDMLAGVCADCRKNKEVRDDFEQKAAAIFSKRAFNRLSGAGIAIWIFLLLMDYLLGRPLFF